VVGHTVTPLCFVYCVLAHHVYSLESIIAVCQNHGSHNGSGGHSQESKKVNGASWKGGCRSQILFLYVLSLNRNAFSRLFWLYGGAYVWHVVPTCQGTSLNLWSRSRFRLPCLLSSNSSVINHQRVFGGQSSKMYILWISLRLNWWLWELPL
jgi:hypothetical protein